MAAVAAVDHRDFRIFGSQPRGAVARMANDDDVGIIGNDPDRVGEALALGGRAYRRVGAGNVGAAESQHGAFEGQARAGRWFVEQARQDEFGRQIGAASDPVGDVLVGEFLQKPLRDLEDRLDLLIGEVIDRNDMARRRRGFRHQSGAIGPIRVPRQARCRRMRLSYTENIAGKSGAMIVLNCDRRPQRGLLAMVMSRFDTHEVFNQSPPYENVDLFSSDAPLQDAVKANGAASEAPALVAFGRKWGTADMFALGRRANENPPKLHSFDPKGFRRDT